MAERNTITTQQFPEFVRAIVHFGYGVHNITKFSPIIGSLGVDELLAFPVKDSDYADILARKNPAVQIGTGYTHLADIRRSMADNFSALTKTFPDLYFDKDYQNDRWFAFRETTSLDEFDFTEVKEPAPRFNPYELFKYALTQGMVEFPSQFEGAYDILTTGTWKGQPIQESYSTHVRENIVRVSEGSEGDIALKFFAALGFFERTVRESSSEGFEKPEHAFNAFAPSAAQINELKRMSVSFFLGRRRVSMAKMPQTGEYTIYKYNSLFRTYCSDQQLLEDLSEARTPSQEI